MSDRLYYQMLTAMLVYPEADIKLATTQSGGKMLIVETGDGDA